MGDAMRKPSRAGILHAASEILSESISELTNADIIPFVSSYFNRADAFLELAHCHGSPLYVFEPEIPVRWPECLCEPHSERVRSYSMLEITIIGR